MNPLFRLVAVVGCLVPLVSMADVRMTMTASVLKSTCDVRISDSELSGHRVTFFPVGQFTPDDFRGQRVAFPSSNTFTLSFPASCDRKGVLRNGRTVLSVAGLPARGANAQSWGDHYEDLAYGIRLMYWQPGVGPKRVVTPQHNQMQLGTLSARQSPRGEVQVGDVVIRPEVRTWAYGRVRPDKALTVPLVFYMTYE